MRRAQDRARNARFRKNGARSATIESRVLGALKLATEASCARWECAREAGRFFCTNLGEIQPIWKIFGKCHFWTLGRILSPCRCNWKNTKPMVKVFHHLILVKIKKNQVNRCSGLRDLVAWEWQNFIGQGKLKLSKFLKVLKLYKVYIFCNIKQILLLFINNKHFSWF